MTTTTGNLSSLRDAAFYTIFQNRNTRFNSTVLEFGADTKFGFYESMCFRFSGISLPARSLVGKAFIRGVAAVTATGAFNTQIQTFARDGRFDVASRTGWSDTVVHDFHAKLQTAASSDLGNTGLTPTDATAWEMRAHTAPEGQTKLGQIVKATATGTLGKIILRLQRVGTISGVLNLTVNIYTVSGGLPGTLLDSTTVTASTVGTSPADFTFTMVGLASITSGTSYFIELDGTYTISASNYINWFYEGNWPAGPYADGSALVYGTGIGFDDQNYPSENNLSNATLTPLGSAPIWAPPDMTLGVAYDTINVREVVQELVNAPGYVDDGLIPMCITPTDPALGEVRQWADYEHSTLDPPQLIIEHRPRLVYPRRLSKGGIYVAQN